jgi:hypothetical protein
MTQAVSQRQRPSADHVATEILNFVALGVLHTGLRETWGPPGTRS